jgi:hypothetical protein
MGGDTTAIPNTSKNFLVEEYKKSVLMPVLPVQTVMAQKVLADALSVATMHSILPTAIH